MEFGATEISDQFQVLCVLQLQLALLHCSFFSFIGGHSLV